MRNRTRRFSSTIGIAISLLVVLLLVVLIQFLPMQIATQQAPQPVAQVIEATKPDSPLPTPITPIVVIEPTWTAWPTATPWPSPTVSNQPTETPIDVISMPNSPEGVLLYSTSNSKNERPDTWNKLELDSRGSLIENSAKSLSGIDKLLTYAQPSPDGKFILFLRPGVADGVPYVYDMETQVTTPLFAHENLYTEYNVNSYDDISGLPFGWHPDGKRVLFWSSRTVYPGLWLVDIKTGERTIVKLTDSLPQGAAISPDGQRIAVAIQGSQYTQLQIVFTNGTVDKTISDINVASFFEWSTDGKQLLLSGSKTTDNLGVGTVHLWLITVETLEFRSIDLPFVWYWPFKATLSRDGRFVAGVGLEKDQHFQCFEKNLSSSEADSCYYFETGIYIEDLATSTVRRLANGVSPTWAPDGSMLAFLSMDTGSPEIWTIYTDGSELTQVTFDKRWKWTNLNWITATGGQQ